MENNNFITGKNIFTLIFLAVIITILTFVFSFYQTPKYKSSAKLLVVFNQESTDAYTAAKNDNYITGILSEVIYSNSFMENVFSGNFNLKDTFGFNPETRQKNWRKSVSVSTLDNKGIIMIDVFNSDQHQAKQFANAITYVLMTKHGIYDGSNSQVSIKLIDNPSVYENWAKTKVARDTIIGLIAGLLVGLSFIVIFPQNNLFGWATDGWSRTVRHDETIKLENGYNYSGNSYPINPPNGYSWNNDLAPVYAPAESENSQPDNVNWLSNYYQENNPVDGQEGTENNQA
ncbi:MAG: Wzz/FepE/Etk N-terminal domain-containing protein [Patescibacteria group bacterium]